ncbi:hypothetical protein FACS1894171_0060 [Clostridia bacterium]|nr:hypothetical protein FACS1894171_0060 [Clostridia bacterium]
MKIFWRISSGVLALALLLSVLCLLPANADAPSSGQPANAVVNTLAADGFRAVWVSTVLNLDYPSKPGLDNETLKREALNILNGAKDMGMTAVVLQVRPSGDALYNSQIFPWSYYLTGSQGVAPKEGFDPLAFWVEEAHKRGLELHAWVNPLRITRGSEKNPSHNLEGLALKNPARQNPQWVVKNPDGNMYYDPGIPEVRKLIVSGVAEIVQNYDVDAVHFDDYFYPGKNFADDSSFKAYGAGYGSRDDWRRDNVNKLIKDVYDTIKSIDNSVEFGVSPFAIWANKSSSPYGSDTRGNESYYYMYADTLKWVKSGWLDYICPQIYWAIGFEIADYGVLTRWWADAVNGTKVKLYIGHAAYRSGTGTKSTDAWYGTGELSRQIALNRSMPQVKGSVFFRYGTIAANPAVYNLLKATYNPSGSGVTPSTPAAGTTLKVGRPAGNAATTFSSYYVLGASDPSKPLLLNGKPVLTRSPDGYFGVMVSLKKGANVLKFTQAGAAVTRTITRGSSSYDSGNTSGSSSSSSSSGTSSIAMTSPEIVKGSAYPDVYDEYRMPGEKVTLKCTAPVGSAVTVKIGGKSYKMNPASTTKPSKGYKPTTFSCTYTIPDTKETGKVIPLGAPVYTMTYGKVTKSLTATGDVNCITTGAPYYAYVSVDSAFSYASNTTSGGPSGELARGQHDYITAVTSGGSWVRLASGQWVLRSEVSRELLKAPIENTITSAEYAPADGRRWEALRLNMSTLPATKVSYNGSTLELTVYDVKSAPQLALPDSSPFESASAVLSTGAQSHAVYTLKIKPGLKLTGYYIATENGCLSLMIRKAPKVSGPQPLSGLTIMVDPGHGGEPGAIGPLGLGMAEKDNVLSVGKKLEAELIALGANVVMTRASDTTVSLTERLRASRAVKPDLFISIHNNAVEVNVDASKIFGLGVYYKESMSKDFAQNLHNYLTDDLVRVKRGAIQQNLYVCRGWWTPAVLIECGFICNPNEFGWLSDGASQSRLARSIANGVVAYFS